MNNIVGFHRWALLLFVFLGLVAFPFQTMKAATEKRLLITDLTTSSIVAVDQEISISVGIIEVEVDNEGTWNQETSIPVNDAEVTMEFTQGDQVITRTLIYDEEGRYSGEVTFPTTGLWETIATAKRVASEAEQEPAILDATLIVVEQTGAPTNTGETNTPDGNSTSDSGVATQFAILIAVALLVLGFMLLRILKRRG